MRDLSLHLLDLIENSLRAGASVVCVTMIVSVRDDLLTMRIDDDGPGFAEPPEVVLDPFYTTKRGKRTGLGLSLFQASAARAGGDLAIGRSDLGGARVEARMGLSHVDRSPLGDLAATLATVACTHPEVDVRLSLASDGGGRLDVSSRQVAATLPEDRRDAIAVAREMTRLVRQGVTRAWPGDG